MSKFRKDKVMPRYMFVAVLLALCGVAVIVKAAYTMTAEKQWWLTVQKNQVNTADSIKKPNRGNVLSCDGQLLAGSIPEYEIFLDFRAGYQNNVPEDTAWTHKRDTLWHEQLDSLCAGLHQIFPQKSAEEFRQHLMEGYNKKSRYWRVWRGKIDYATFSRVKELPFFNLPRHKGGFWGQEFPARRHPFGSLAERTIGSRDTARYGVELAYDSLLTGTYGIAHTQKVRNRRVSVVTRPPVDGADVVTTLDVGMQDLCEKALLDELKLRNALMGVAILMEVPTGDVKAIVNMEKSADGEYRERLNNALGYRCEPGSVFKTASILVALDDGVVDTSYVIHTGNGLMRMHGANMKDHNYSRGGYGSINVARSLEVSSNVGVSYVIDHFYGSNPTKYVEGLHRVGIGADLQIPLNEYRAPKIRYPDTKTTNRSLYWSKTTLPWMSIGYETQIAPINTLAFYNAIANDGKMMQPRFVTKVLKDGETVREYPPVVLKDRIAKPETIKMMQTILEHVVSQGLGRKAAPLSRAFKVAGKTGTAQIADEHGGYHSGITRYWLSFAGFFPADNPRYSCIVCLRKSGLPASGGGMSGVVFRHIAEGVMAQNVKRLVDDIRDSTSNFTPEVKVGDEGAATYVLNRIGTKGTPVKAKKVARNIVPDVTGMGARDAVHELEARGLKVIIHGRGKVKSQSIAAGKTATPGERCELNLEI